MSTPLRQNTRCIAFRICLSCLILTLLIHVVLATISHGISASPNDDLDTKSWAIVLGVGEYKNLGIDTTYADDDGICVSKQLGLLWGSDCVKLLVDTDVVKNNVRDAIYNWLVPKENENDTILFFFAGHGDGEYMRLYDSIEGSNINDIHYSEFQSWLEVLESQNIVIIMDFCGSGRFAKNLSGNDSVILTCGTNGEKCWQEETYAHGIFSYYLIEALRNLESVDTNQDRAVSAEELFNYVSLEVASEYEAYPPPSLQHPQLINHMNRQLTLFQIPSAETYGNESKTITSRLYNNYTYLWIVAGVIPILIATTLLMIFKRRGCPPNK